MELILFSLEEYEHEEKIAFAQHLDLLSFPKVIKIAVFALLMLFIFKATMMWKS